MGDVIKACPVWVWSSRFKMDLSSFGDIHDISALSSTVTTGHSLPQLLNVQSSQDNASLLQTMTEVGATTVAGHSCSEDAVVSYNKVPIYYAKHSGEGGGRAFVWR